MEDNYYQHGSTAATGVGTNAHLINAYIESQGLGNNSADFFAKYGLPTEGKDAFRIINANPQIFDRILSDIGQDASSLKSSLQGTKTVSGSSISGAPTIAGSAADIAYNDSLHTASQPAPVSSQGIDSNYFMKPGETSEAYSARVAAYNKTKNTPVSTISNPLTPPSTNGAPPAPTLPKASAGSTADQYFGGLTAQLDSQKKAYQAEADRRAKEYQTQIDRLDAQMKASQSKEDAATASMGEEVRKQAHEKRAALDLEKERFDENYNANQALTNELDGLLTQGNQIVEQMKNTTGLASIMNPRITKTMTDVTARAGVIQAVLAARNDQIGLAHNQLASSLSAISSIYGDQIDYYKTLIDYYENQKDETGKRIVSATNDQKAYLDTKLSMLENDMANVQKTTDLISKAMLDPDTALAYARSGVSLTDSPASINQKLATYAYSKELADTSNEMASNGYSTTPIAGVAPVQITDSKGNVKLYYKKPTATGGSGGGSGGSTRSVVDDRLYRQNMSQYLEQIPSYTSRNEALADLNKYKASMIASVGQQGYNEISAEIDRQFPAPGHTATGGIDWSSYQSVNNLSSFLFAK